MPAWGWVLVGLGLAGAEILLLVKVIMPRLVKSNWGALESRFPPAPPLPGSVRREFESFRVGGLQLGSSVHVEVDAAYLHLFPAWLARRMGCAAMSVPWEEVRVLGGFSRTQCKASIGGVRVVGPRWCLEMADAKTQEGGRSSAG